MKSSRDLVIAELDRRRDLGIPFKIAEVAESTGCSPGTISTYSRHYVAKIADRLISQAVDNEGDYDAWMHEFNTFKHRSEAHTSELQSLLLNSYAVFCLKKKQK